MISDQDISKEVNYLNVYEREIEKYINPEVDVESDIIQCRDTPETIARRLNDAGLSKLFIHPGRIRDIRRLHEWIKDVDHIANLDIDHNVFSRLFRANLTSISEIERGLNDHGEVFITYHRNIGSKTYVKIIEAINEYREGESIEISC